MDQIDLGRQGHTPGEGRSEKAKPSDSGNGGAADAARAEQGADTGKQQAKSQCGGAWDDVKYKYLIIAENSFIVFIDDEGDVDWKTTDEYDIGLDKEKLYQRESHAGVLNEVALLESTPCFGLRDSTRIQFKRLIGEALARSFSHDYAGAHRMVTAAQHYIRVRSEEVSRLWYLTASSGMAFAFVLLGGIAWLGRKAFQQFVGVEGVWIAIACAAGAVGALLSVILRSGELRFDPSAGKALHYLEGASRIIAGSISGLVVAAAVHSGLVLSALATGDKRPIMLLLAAFAGGTGERLASSIISRFDPITGKPDASPPDVKPGAEGKPAINGKQVANRSPSA